MEAAGSVAASDSRSGQQQQPHQQQQQQQQQNEEEEESMLQGGGSVNWGQAAGAHSPRVPRSQISRAHPAAGGGAYGERTSAVLSAPSGDDETALSAAEAAGEHTSEPQGAVGYVGEAQGEAMGVTMHGGGAAAAAASMGPGAGSMAQHPHVQSHQMQQQLPALSLTAPTPRGRSGFELASSPPASTSPIYRANSVVSYTAAPAKGAHHPQQQQQHRRGADTPASAPAAAQVLGTSPNTSRGEFASAVPRGPRRGGAFSAGLPPTSGHRPATGHPHHQQQHHHQQHHQSAAAAAAAAALAGPSRPSLSGTQSHAATAGAAAAHSMPSTLAVALGPLSPPGGALLGQMPPPPTSLADLLPYAASMGLQPSQLGSMAAALLAQSSVLGAQQQQQQSVQGVQQGQQGQQQHIGGESVGAVMPPPPPLQQQVEALQNIAAMLQAQASAMMSGTAGMQAAVPAALQSPTAGGVQQQQQQGGEMPVASVAGQAQPATSQGAASVQSLLSLMGASAIQGHPLPPPFHPVGGATTPVPLQSFGGTPATAAAAAAAPATVQSGAFAAPGPLAGATTPLPAVPALSEMQGSAMQPALAALLQYAHQGPLLTAHGAHALAAALAGPLQQATSAVLGSGNGGGGGGSGGSQPQQRPSPPSLDPQQAAADEERRRHAGDPPQPQAATIQELPTADLAAASQGGGVGGPPGLQLAVPQEAAMMGGNSTFGDAMELGGDEEDEDAMEVQQEAAGGTAEGQGGHLPPAPHGAASVMATLITENGGGGERSEGNDEEMVQQEQGASGPSGSAAAAAQPAQYLSRSRAEPAAATAHNTGAPSAHTTATQPSQEGPTPSNQGQLVHGPSSLATISTGNGERAGGSVEMATPPSQQHAQHATLVPAGLPLGCGGSKKAETAAHAAFGVMASAAAAAGAHPAASAPAAVPLQQQQQQLGGLVGAGLAGQQPGPRPAASASVSGQGDTPGVLWQHGSAAVASQHPSAAAALAAQQAHVYGGDNHVPMPPAAPAYASMCGGQHDGAPGPRTDARSRSFRAASVPAGGPAQAPATAEGMGSPTASRHAGQQRESQGTARATFLAGAAHSILTTAAAGEAEAMDEGGEALSPLVTAKASLTQGTGGLSHAHLPGGPSHHAHAVAAAAGTGSVGGALHPLASAVAGAAGRHATSAAFPVQAANGFGSHEPSLSLPHDMAQQADSPGFASPIDLSTMAVDLAPPAGNLNGTAGSAGTADQPQPSASFQPSSLPPPAAVAAALHALEQQQAALNEGIYNLLPPAAEQLGELYHALQQQNGYATHASSVIGNACLAQSSPERELTSPSHLVTHDSTGSGSRQQHSKHSSKRRRTSVGPAGSSQHA